MLDGNVLSGSLLEFGSQDPVNKVLDLSSSMSARTKIPSNLFRFLTGLKNCGWVRPDVPTFPPTAALQRLSNLRRLSGDTNIAYLPPSLLFSQTRLVLNLSGSPVAER